MMKIKHIDVFSAAKMGFVICGYLGLIWVALALLAGTTGFKIPGYLEPGTGLVGRIAWHMGRGALIIVRSAFDVLGYAISGFISGALTAFFYNFVARRHGGLKVELEPVPDLFLQS